jgi:hypothetical protein
LVASPASFGLLVAIAIFGSVFCELLAPQSRLAYRSRLGEPLSSFLSALSLPFALLSVPGLALGQAPALVDVIGRGAPAANRSAPVDLFFPCCLLRRRDSSRAMNFDSILKVAPLCFVVQSCAREVFDEMLVRQQEL